MFIYSAVKELATVFFERASLTRLHDALFFDWIANPRQPSQLNASPRTGIKCRHLTSVYNDVIDTQPALRVSCKPNRLTGCVQVANYPSCTAQRVFFDRAWIRQDRSDRIRLTRFRKIFRNLGWIVRRV